MPCSEPRSLFGLFSSVQKSIKLSKAEDTVRDSFYPVGCGGPVFHGEERIDLWETPNAGYCCHSRDESRLLDDRAHEKSLARPASSRSVYDTVASAAMKPVISRVL